MCRPNFDEHAIKNIVLRLNAIFYGGHRNVARKPVRSIVL